MIQGTGELDRQWSCHWARPLEKRSRDKSQPRLLHALVLALDLGVAAYREVGRLKVGPGRILVAVFRVAPTLASAVADPIATRAAAVGGVVIHSAHGLLQSSRAGLVDALAHLTVWTGCSPGAKLQGRCKPNPESRTKAASLNRPHQIAQLTFGFTRIFPVRDRPSEVDRSGAFPPKSNDIQEMEK